MPEVSTYAEDREGLIFDGSNLSRKHDKLRGQRLLKLSSSKTRLTEEPMLFH